MEYKVKSLKFTFLGMALIIFSTISISGKNSVKINYAEQDSVNLLAEFSLFYESYKNKDYESAMEHGWTILELAPDKYLQFRPYKKMEDVIWYYHDSVATSDEERQVLADTMLYVYDRAVEYKAKKPEYFILKKAYVLETWTDTPVEEVIAAYEYAFEVDPNADTFYKDRLGIILAQNATDENGYKLIALDLYSKLSEDDPENDVWISRIDGLAEDIDELIKIRKISWDLDKENLEKAWKYAETCIQGEAYEAAIEPLDFLTKKSPEVINYWRRLANMYQKVDQTDDAIAAYKTLISLEPNNRDNYFNIAIIYKELNQLSVARSYLQKASKASEEPWDMPIFLEGQLYEQSARNCGSFEFMDKCVYKLASDTYKKAASIHGPITAIAVERVKALDSTVPQQEDYFFRSFKSGDKIKIEGTCYDWINRSIKVR